MHHMYAKVCVPQRLFYTLSYNKRWVNYPETWQPPTTILYFYKSENYFFPLTLCFYWKHCILNISCRCRVLLSFETHTIIAKRTACNSCFAIARVYLASVTVVFNQSANHLGTKQSLGLPKSKLQRFSEIYFI